MFAEGIIADWGPQQVKVAFQVPRHGLWKAAQVARAGLPSGGDEIALFYLEIETQVWRGLLQDAGCLEDCLCVPSENDIV